MPMSRNSNENTTAAATALVTYQGKYIMMSYLPNPVR